MTQVPSATRLKASVARLTRIATDAFNSGSNDFSSLKAATASARTALDNHLSSTGTSVKDFIATPIGQEMYAKVSFFGSLVSDLGLSDGSALPSASTPVNSSSDFKAKVALAKRRARAKASMASNPVSSSNEPKPMMFNFVNLGK